MVTHITKCKKNSHVRPLFCVAPRTPYIVGISIETSNLIANCLAMDEHRVRCVQVANQHTTHICPQQSNDMAELLLLVLIVLRLMSSGVTLMSLIP